MFRSALVLLLVLPASLARERRLKSTKAPTHSGKSSKAVWEKKLTLYPIEGEYIFGQSLSPPGGYENEGPPMHKGKPGHRGKQGPHEGKRSVKNASAALDEVEGYRKADRDVSAEKIRVQRYEKNLIKGDPSEVFTDYESGKAIKRAAMILILNAGEEVQVDSYDGSEWLGMDSHGYRTHITWEDMHDSTVVPHGVEWVESDKNEWYECGDQEAMWFGTDHLANEAYLVKQLKEVMHVPDGWKAHGPPPHGPPPHGPPRHPGGPSFEIPPLEGSAFIQSGCVGDNCRDNPDPLNHYSVHCTVLQAAYKYDYDHGYLRNLRENRRENGYGKGKGNRNEGYGKGTGKVGYGKDHGPNLPTGVSITKQMCNIDICHGSDEYDSVGIKVPNCFYLRYSGPTDLNIDFLNGGDFQVPQFAAALYGGTGAFSGAKGEAILEDVGESIDVHIRWIETKGVNGIFEEDVHVIEYDGLIG